MALTYHPLSDVHDANYTFAPTNSPAPLDARVDTPCESRFTGELITPQGGRVADACRIAPNPAFRYVVFA